MTNDSYNIQQLLDVGGIVILPDGDYSIQDTLLLGSDTILIASPKAKFIRNAKTALFGAKPGATNVTVNGGRWIGHGPDIAANAYGDLTFLFKANNIHIENAIFEDTLGSHSIDIVACKDVFVDNCKFLGHNVDPEGSFREAIQIDFAGYNSLPIYPNNSPYYDLSTCDGIHILNCKFDKSNRYPAPYNAIGTHSQPNSSNKSKNIFIKDNIARGNGAYGSYGFFVSCVNFDKAIISNNIVENYNRFIRIFSSTTESGADGSLVYGANSYCKNIKVHNNIVTLFENFKSPAVYGISNNGVAHTDIEVYDNTFISDDLESTAKYLTDFVRCQNIVVRNNKNNSIFDIPFKFQECVNYIEHDNIFY